MKIVYCIAGLQHSGGMERVLANKASRLTEEGFEVTVVTTDGRGEKPFFPLPGKVRIFDLGIGYEKNNGKSFPDKLLHYPFKQWKHRRRLAKLLKEIRPDITVSMFGNEASFLWKIRDGSRKVLESHFSRYKRLQYGRKGIWGAADRFRNWEDGRTARHYDAFVVLTEEDRGYWGEIPGIKVIPNACNLKPEQGALLNEKAAIAVGRLDGQKNFMELILAWQKIDKRHPEWKLRIFGEGMQRKELSEFVAENGLEKSVLLMRPVRNIEAEYLKSSMILMSSRYEGLPMALLEAQACGLPLLSYACKCGPRDIISEGQNGFLIEGNRPEKRIAAMAARIERLIGDEKLRKKMGAESRKNAVRYSEEAVMKQWKGLFESLQKK